MIFRLLPVDMIYENVLLFYVSQVDCIGFSPLQALRKVSAKIVSNYQKDPGPAVEDYLNLMASDMNWYML